MTKPGPLDCVVIGYNEPPFEQYEALLRRYGEDSEAYRDLRLSFVEVDGRKLTCVDLFNHLWGWGGAAGGPAPFRSGEIPNLAAVYLTSFLRRRGFRTDYVNLFQDEKERLAELLAEGPVAVAITTTFYVLNFPVIEMVELIRAHNPHVKIVVGGPLIANHVRNYRGEELEAALRDLGADVYVVEGQGEATLALLLQCLRDGGDLAKIPNLLYSAGGRFLRTPVAPEANDLDAEAVDWLRLSEADLGPTLQTRTARSCAFSCSFCNYPTRAGKLALASLATLERELDSIAARGNVRNLVFIDDTFNVPLPRFKDLCRLMIRKRYGFQWFSYFRCSNSDEETVQLMAESGCTGVFLGIESGSPEILENMHKAATIEKYARGIEWLRACGILTFGSFIVGFPGETARTVAETTAFIRSTQPDYYRAQMWYNEAGTPIHDQRDKYGIQGDGFVWSHDTMDSMEAMDHIERMFLTVEDSIWLPQWSFDFWIIPYLLGKGMSLETFRELMADTKKLMALGVASVPEDQKRSLAAETLERLGRAMHGWKQAA